MSEKGKSKINKHSRSVTITLSMRSSAYAHNAFGLTSGRVPKSTANWPLSLKTSYNEAVLDDFP